MKAKKERLLLSLCFCPSPSSDFSSNLCVAPLAMRVLLLGLLLGLACLGGALGASKTFTYTTRGPLPITSVTNGDRALRVRRFCLPAYNFGVDKDTAQTANLSLALSVFPLAGSSSISALARVSLDASHAELSASSSPFAWDFDGRVSPEARGSAYVVIPLVVNGKQVSGAATDPDLIFSSLRNTHIFSGTVATDVSAFGATAWAELRLMTRAPVPRFSGALEGSCVDPGCGSGKTFDQCGACVPAGSSTTCSSCSQTVLNLVEDACGVCDGNDKCVGCDGIANSGKTLDKCGVCGGANACVGCDDVPNSGKVVDKCGVCGGDGSSCAPIPLHQPKPSSPPSEPPTPPPSGCDGMPDAHYDICGVCMGNGKSCLGCDGVANSSKVVDGCGVCGGDGSTCKACDKTKGCFPEHCDSTDQNCKFPPPRAEKRDDAGVRLIGAVLFVLFALALISGAMRKQQ
jgi:hypothetical protein